jgi:hypothetical protein
MTNQHRATPEQWETIERYADTSDPYSCLLGLRARIEALEVGQQPLAFTGKVVAPITRDRDGTGDYLIVHDTQPPASSLVERVADALAAQATSAGIVNDRPARAAIREIAAWLKEQGYSTLQAEALAREANQ